MAQAERDVAAAEREPVEVWCPWCRTWLPLEGRDDRYVRREHDAENHPDRVKDRKVGEVAKDATTPLKVADALNKLASRNGTERVLAAVKDWVAYIERQKARAGENRD